MKTPETIPEEIPQIDLVGYSEQGLAEYEIGLAGRAKELVLVADEFAITDEKTLTEAIDVTAQIKAAYDQIESERDQYTRPMLLLKRMADGKFKAITDPLQAAEKKLKSAILAFQRAEQKKIDDAARAQAETERKAQAEHDARTREAEEKGTILPPPIPAPAPPPPSVAPAYGNYGSKATTKSKWVHEVEDLSAVPLKYLQVDDKAVKQAIRDGVRKIPGIKIIDEGTVAFT